MTAFEICQHTRQRGLRLAGLMVGDIFIERKSQFLVHTDAVWYSYNEKNPGPKAWERLSL